MVQTRGGYRTGQRKSSRLINIRTSQNNTNLPQTTPDNLDTNTNQDLMQHSDDDFVNPPPGTKEKSSIRNIAGKRFKTRAKREIIESDPEFDQESTNEETETDIIEEDVAEKQNKNKRKSMRATILQKRLIDEPTDDEEEHVQQTTINTHKKKKVRRHKNKKATTEEQEEDSDKEITSNKLRKKKNKQDSSDEEPRIITLKTRTSPKILAELIDCLTTEQKEWLITTGFGPLLDFKLEKLPHRLGHKVLDAFHHTSCCLILQSGTIEVLEEHVTEIMGLPAGKRKIKFCEGDGNGNLKKWKDQFPNKEMYKISASNVVEKIRKSKHVDDLFKLNFLVVMCNALIESQTNPYLSRKIISFDGDLDQLAQYNWADYLLKSLILSKANWQQTTTSMFYTGPLLFLILFYVDRLQCEKQMKVKRESPVFKAWNKDLLKERELLEIKHDCFGVGTILQHQNISNQQEDQERVENHDLLGAEDSIERLNMKAGLFLDAKLQFELELEKAKTMHPNDTRIADIEETVKQAFKHSTDQQQTPMHFETTHQPNSADQFPNDKNGDQHSTDQQQTAMQFETTHQPNSADQVSNDKNGDQHSTDQQQTAMQFETTHIDNVLLENVETIEWLHSEEGRKKMEELSHQNEDHNAMEFETTNEDPDILDNIDTIEWLHSAEGKKKMAEQVDIDCQPSFSLGQEVENLISKVCKEINSHDDLKTPVQQRKTKRDMKIGPSFRSPYVDRNIDINGRYTSQENLIWQWLLNDNQDKWEPFFVCGQQICFKHNILTMKPGKDVHYSVLDVWSTLMNEKEQYRSQDSPMRLFINVSTMLGTLDSKKNDEEKYKIFSENMNYFFQNLKIKMDQIDMVFFTVHAHDHYYLVVFNLKNISIDVIDNIKRPAKSALEQYNHRILLLQNHFTKYMEELELLNLAEKIRNLTPSHFRLQWQTTENHKDCALFAMRHMETYMGQKKNWDPQIKKEKCGQQEQMDKMRVKYTYAILTSQLNEKREYILDASKAFQKMILAEKMKEETEIN